MTILNSELVETIIAKIKLNNGHNLIDLISNIVIKENNIGFAIDISKIGKEEAEKIKKQATELLSEIKDIGKITIILTAQNLEEKTAKKQKYYIDGVKKVILVAAGKGGVGKSTIAALLAQQLRDQNHKVGIVDADLYGPSIPQIFGIDKKPEIQDKMMMPLEVQNIQINSIGFLIDNESALAWRGPMASKAIYQLLSLTKWQDLDYLIIDMPPGTGDIHLSIIENYHIGGAVIVTTPQKLSIIDVKKAINLYQKFNIKMLGIIENMSYYLAENSRQNTEIFSGQGGKYLANLYNIPLLAKLPISAEIARACDMGENLSDIIQLPIDKFIRQC